MPSRNPTRLYSIPGGRVSFNPTPNWALQASAGHLHSPEQLEPDADVDRMTASVSYNRPLADGNRQTTAAWGENRKHAQAQDGVLVESDWSTRSGHTIFGRAEWAAKDELFTVDPLQHATFSVGKLSVGYIYDFAHPGHVGVGVGSVYAILTDLEFSYGGSTFSFMLFVQHPQLRLVSAPRASGALESRRCLRASLWTFRDSPADSRATFTTSRYSPVLHDDGPLVGATQPVCGPAACTLALAPLAWKTLRVSHSVHTARASRPGSLVHLPPTPGGRCPPSPREGPKAHHSP